MWKVFLEYLLVPKLPSSFFCTVKLDDLMMNHHVLKLQPPEFVLRKMNPVNNFAHGFSSIQLNINLSLSPGYIKTICCKTSCREDLLYAQKHKGWEKPYSCLIHDNVHGSGWMEWPQRGTVQLVWATNHPRIPQTVPKFVIISATTRLWRRNLVLGMSRCFLAFT
jgi:hypothetical protein